MFRRVHRKRGYFRTCIAIMIVVALLTSSVPTISSAQDQDYTIKIESANLSARGDAMISGNHMVWTAFVDKKIQVFYRNLKTGAEKQLTAGNVSSKHAPKVSEDENGNVYVVWLSGVYGSLWGMSLTDKQERLLSSSTNITGPVSIDGSQVVWSDQSHQTYYYSFQSGKEVILGEGDYANIIQDKIVYAGYGSIILYDIPSKQTYTLYLSDNESIHASNLKFNGTYAIFRQSYGSKTNFALADFSNPLSPVLTELTEFKDQKQWVNDLLIGDRYAAWIEDQNGSPYLMGVELANKKKFSIGEVKDPRNVMYFVGDGIAMKGEDHQIAIHRIIAKTAAKQEEIAPVANQSIEPVTVTIPYSVPSNALEVAVEGEHLAWLEAGEGDNATVYYMNLRTGEKKRITWFEMPRRDIAISEDYIAWVQLNPSIMQFEPTWEPYVQYYRKSGGAERQSSLGYSLSDLTLYGDELIAHHEKDQYVVVDILKNRAATLHSETYPKLGENLSNISDRFSDGHVSNGQYMLWREDAGAGTKNMWMLKDLGSSELRKIIGTGVKLGEPYIGDTLGFWLETAGGKSAWKGIRLADNKSFEMAYNPSEQLLGVWGDMLVFKQGSKLIGKTLKHLAPKFEPKLDPIMVKIDGEELAFTEDAQPYIAAGTTMVPFRAVFEKLGLKIAWDSKDQTIKGSSNRFTISLKIGSRDAVVNGKSVKLAAAPVIVNGNTMIPLRFIGEATDYEVIWDANLRAVYLAEKSSLVKAYYPNGQLAYEGQARNGKPHGKGKLYSEEGKLLFDTEFVNGEIKGIGTKYLVDGGKVVGGVEAGFGHGHIQYYLSYGLMWYEGETVYGFWNGQGKEYDHNDGGLKYEGEFVDNEWEGYGKLYYKNGNLEYEGYFEDDKFHGYGKYYNRDGTLEYEGEFVNGSRKKDE